MNNFCFHLNFAFDKVLLSFCLVFSVCISYKTHFYGVILAISLNFTHYIVFR